METSADARRSRVDHIRELNDSLRRSGRGGRVVMTAAVAALAPKQIAEIVAAVASFNAFDCDNDPHGEHDFGSLTAAGQQVIWKIDYYDPTQTAHSPDAKDPRVTSRVLTIMLADDY